MGIKNAREKTYDQKKQWSWKFKRRFCRLPTPHFALGKYFFYLVHFLFDLNFILTRTIAPSGWEKIGHQRNNNTIKKMVGNFDGAPRIQIRSNIANVFKTTLIATSSNKVNAISETSPGSYLNTSPRPWPTNEGTSTTHRIDNFKSKWQSNIWFCN